MLPTRWGHLSELNQGGQRWPPTAKGIAAIIFGYCLNCGGSVYFRMDYNRQNLKSKPHFWAKSVKNRNSKGSIPTLRGNDMRKPNHWQRGEFSKAVVIYCIRWMTAVLVWAIIVTTIAAVTDRTVYLTEVLTFASAFFGGELCLLALKRILAKERKDNGEVDTYIQPDHCAGISTDFDVPDPIPSEEDQSSELGDDLEDDRYRGSGGGTDVPGPW